MTELPAEYAGKLGEALKEFLTEDQTTKATALLGSFDGQWDRLVAKRLHQSPRCHRTIDSAAHFLSDGAIEPIPRLARLLKGILGLGNLGLVLVKDGELDAETRAKDDIPAFRASPLGSGLNYRRGKASVGNGCPCCVGQDIAATL